VDAEPKINVRLRQTSEAIVMGMACLAPWAFGSVEAWAQLVLALGLAVLVVLRLVIGLHSRSAIWQWTNVPSLAFAALALFAAFQAISWPAPRFGEFAPSTAQLRADLVPEGPQSVIGEPELRVAAPAMTLALDTEAARSTAIQLAAAWILFQCVLGLDGGFGFLRRLGLVTVANASIMALFSLVQSLSWEGRIFGVRPSPITNGWYTGGPFVCHNHLAAYLNIALGFGVGLLISSLRQNPNGRRTPSMKVQGQQLWITYAMVVIVVGVVSSHSRTGVLAMLASAGVTYVFLRPSKIRIPVGVFAVLAMIPVLLIAVGSASSFQRLATLTDSDSLGLNGRMAIWGRAFGTWLAHPIWGVGLGSFEVASSMTPQPYLGVTYYHAENEYLELLTEGGVIALAMVLAAVVGVILLGRRAFIATSSRNERALLLGAMFSGLALAIQCLADFPLHVPGISFTAVALCAHVCSLGLRIDAKSQAAPVASPSWKLRWGSLIDLALCGLSLAIVSYDWNLTSADAAAAGSGFSHPGSFLPGTATNEESATQLGRSKTALERSLLFRPDWAEGHYRLGVINLKLYEIQALKWLDPDAVAGNDAAGMADPLWLHGLVHSTTETELAEFGGVIDQEPVKHYLVPAARCFLQARRCCPFRAPAHAHLASLDYLIKNGESTATHAVRALRLSGADSQVTMLAAVVAAQAGEIDVVAPALRRTLVLRSSEWATIADFADNVLTPAEILNEVLPLEGGYEIRFADRLFAEPEDQAARTLFLNAALERAADNATLTPAERQWFQGQAWARLGDRGKARQAMNEALVLESTHSDRRQELVRWLLEWGLIEEANTHVRIGLGLDPDHDGLRKEQTKVVDAIARGNTSVASGSKP
jgi:O-antigen ligase